MRLRALIATALLLLVVGGARAQGVRDEAWRNMTPQQRENLWQSMTPQQRADFWRRLTPEQRQAIRQQIPSEQRDAIRQRMLEERARGLPPEAPSGPGAQPIPGMGPGGPGPRRLSPEERQKLREQITESTRDLREQRRHMGMERRKGRER
jgi:hypothetical protein